MKYTKEQIKEMRRQLADRDIEQSDMRTLFDMFMEGCVGWENFTDNEVIEEFENSFGEDYFETVD